MSGSPMSKDVFLTQLRKTDRVEGFIRETEYILDGQLGEDRNFN